jgi:hypothetical protein
VRFREEMPLRLDLEELGHVGGDGHVQRLEAGGGLAAGVEHVGGPGALGRHAGPVVEVFEVGGVHLEQLTLGHEGAGPVAVSTTPAARALTALRTVVEETS